MKNMKHLLSAVIACTTLLANPTLAQDKPVAAQPGDQPQVNRNYKDLVGSIATEQMPILTEGLPVYVGYALKPFRSRDDAMKEALGKAAKSGRTTLLALADREQTYPATNPPPGSFSGGVYAVVALTPIQVQTVTPDLLFSELKRHIFSSQSVVTEHSQWLLQRIVADKPAGAPDELKALIRSVRAEQMNALLAEQLVQSVFLLTDSSSGEDMLRWAKFHKNSGARQASLLALIKLGRIKEVEEALKTEVDRKVKATVERQLI